MLNSRCCLMVPSIICYVIKEFYFFQVLRGVEHTILMCELMCHVYSTFYNIEDIYTMGLVSKNVKRYTYRKHV